MSELTAKEVSDLISSQQQINDLRTKLAAAEEELNGLRGWKGLGEWLNSHIDDGAWNGHFRIAWGMVRKFKRESKE